jgi:hypothetical protein
MITMMCIGSGRRFVSRAAGRKERRQKKSSGKDLPGMWPGFCVAQKMGKRLGSGEILQRSVSTGWLRQGSLSFKNQAFLLIV